MFTAALFISGNSNVHLLTNNVVYPYNRILLSNKNNDIGYNMNFENIVLSKRNQS